MSGKRLVVLLCCFVVFKGALTKPATETGSSVYICYSLNCPEGTTICGKHSEVSEEDKTKLNVQVRCYDEDGDLLKSKNTTEVNPFGPNVYYKGTKLSAVVKILPSYLFGEEPNDDKEPEANPLDFPAKATSGPKSEVEDLNGR